MRITDDAIKNAVVEIFFELKVAANGRLSMRDLELEWQRARMRGSDLERGIQALVVSGDLSREREQWEVFIKLTPQGFYNWTSAPGKFVPWIKHHWSWVQSRLARKRQRNEAIAHAWRRAGDFAR